MRYTGAEAPGRVTVVRVCFDGVANEVRTGEDSSEKSAEAV